MGFDIGGAFRDLGNKINNTIVKPAQHGSNQLNHKIESGVKTTIHKAEQETKKITNTIKSGTVNTAKTIDRGFNAQKPNILDGIQKATRITAGIVSLSPVGKAVLMAATAGGDAGSHGGASAYLGLNNTNSTLSMMPAGLLAQQVANVATNDRAGQALNSTLPDPKRMAVHDAKTIVKTGLTNPSQLKSTLPALAHQNAAQVKAIVKHDTPHTLSNVSIPSVKQIAAATKPNLLHTISPPTTIKSTISTITKPIHDLPKPSLIPRPPDVKKVVEKVGTLGNKIEKGVKTVIPQKPKSTLDIPPPAPDAPPSQQLTPLTTDDVSAVMNSIDPPAPTPTGNTLDLIGSKVEPDTTSSQAVVPYEKFNLIEWLLRILGIY